MPNCLPVFNAFPNFIWQKEDLQDTLYSCCYPDKRKLGERNGLPYFVVAGLIKLSVKLLIPKELSL